jgi:hypothetical protein
MAANTISQSRYMEFRRKIVVISGGANRFGQALAEGLMHEGARVIIADSDACALKKIALRTGATTIITDCKNKNELKLFIDKLICLFGKIDLFISNGTIDWLEDLLLPEQERILRWHINTILQLHLAKYLLPHMFKRKCGHIISTIPDNRLLEEFSSPFYSTLKHIALNFAERLAATCKEEGIKVSVISQRTVFAFERMGLPALKEHFTRSGNLADFIIDAIHKEQFLISADDRISRSCYNEQKGIDGYRKRKAKTEMHTRHQLQIR